MSLNKPLLTRLLLCGLLGFLSSSTSRSEEAQAPSEPKSHRMPAAQVLTYSCDGGVKVVVQLRENTARVLFKDKSYSMKLVESASGARYSDGSIAWWNKGYDGLLQDESDPSHPVMLAANCKQVSPPPNPPVAKAPGTVSGTVGYRERIAMPENAVLTIQLQDISRAGAPARVIAEEKITLAGRQVPLPFELTYNPRHIHAKHTYAVSARITVDGHSRFVTTTAYHVITRGNPTTVDVLLQAVETRSK